MIIVEPSVELLSQVDGSEMLRAIEVAGRVCYKSEERITDGSAEKFVRALIRRGHESVLEHEKVTVRIICDRGVSHEIVRHRLASYSQESTRYCNYARGEIAVVRPAGFDSWSPELKKAWYLAMTSADLSYHAMIRQGASPEVARAVLPNSLKTEIVMTANLREWRHFLRMRCDKAAHPDMRVIAFKLLQRLYEACPAVFEDIHRSYTEEGSEGLSERSGT